MGGMSKPKVPGVVIADVLDASFPPAPQVVSALEHQSLALAASQPMDGVDLIQTIASVRGVPEESVTIGAGSSSLMYPALGRWLTSKSRVLLPDPTYEEYVHIIKHVVDCRVDRMILSHANDYRVDVDSLKALLDRGVEEKDPYDLVVLVNPNNPTGSFVERADLEALVSKVDTRFLIDEAYIEYLGPGHSMEPFAARSENTIVCKSLSKCYGLSDVRAAYLCGPPAFMKELRLGSAEGVDTTARIAATEALRSGEYYEACYAEMRRLREELARQLRERLPIIEVCPGAANWILCYLPPSGPDAAVIRVRCRKHNVFVRNCEVISELFGTHTVRITVKDSVSNNRIVAALESAMSE